MEENTKLDLVNPMNPNQVLDSKILVKKVEEKVEEKVEVKTKKKNKLILPLVIVLIALLGVYAVTTFSSKPTTRPIPSKEPVVEKSITLKTITDYFNDNVKNYLTDKEITAEVIDNTHMIVSYTDEKKYDYEFSFSNGYLVATIQDTYPNIKEVSSYLISAIGMYYDIPFEDTMTSLEDKEEIPNVTTSTVNSIVVLRINTEKISE